MKKRKKGRILHRKKGPREALIKGITSKLFLHGRIQTTEAKAKEIRPFAEKKITLARNGGLQAVRRLSKDFSKNITKKLVEEIAPRYKNRPGGYVRIIRMNPRKSDGAKMAIIELVK